MAHYYKHDIPRWQKGTAELSDRAYRVYHVIVQQIMIAEGPILYHDKTLAGISNRSTRDLRAAVDELVTSGKIEIIDGMIHNDRCEREIDSLNSTRKNISLGRRNGRNQQNSEGGSPEKTSPMVGEWSSNGPRMVREWSSNGPRMVREYDEKINEIKDSELVQLPIDKTRQDKTKKEKNKQKSEHGSIGSGEADAPPEKSVKEVLQEVLNAETAAALISHRKAKRAPLTKLAAELLVKQFEAYGDPQWAAETILTQGWQGFRAKWMDDYPRPAADAANTKGISDETWAQRVKTWVTGGGRDSQWYDFYGPVPGRDGCCVPSHILAEFGLAPQPQPRSEVATLTGSPVASKTPQGRIMAVPAPQVVVGGANSLGGPVSCSGESYGAVRA